MDDKERYKEVFSQIHPTKHFDPEELYMKKRNRNMTKRIVCAAAAVAVLTSLCLAAYAVNFYGLRDLLLPEQHEVRLPLDPTDTTQDNQPADREQQTYMADMISLAGYADTPESRANAEWRAFLSAYDPDGAIIGQTGNSPTGFEDAYDLYPVYTQEMADKLEEIAAKYSLKLHTSMLDDLYTDEALCDQVGGDFLGENRAYSAYMYEDGTFKFDGEIELADYGLLDYQFQRCVRGSFSDMILNIRDVNDYTEWAYTTQSGTPVTLALAPHKALIIADLPDSFVTINVLAGTETPVSDILSSGAFHAEDLERFADSFDFGVLTPARPADPSLPRPTLDEALGKPTAEEFYRISGIREPEAQAFFAEFSACVERGDRQAVAEMLRYPAVVTRWHTTAAGTYLVENPVENAEEFLPYYDDIFTESLWLESILSNQYTRERSDLIPDNGMVRAAGGAVWFMQTKDGMKVITVQNSEGNSIRQSESGITAGPVPITEQSTTAPGRPTPLC